MVQPWKFDQSLVRAAGTSYCGKFGVRSIGRADGPWVLKRNAFRNDTFTQGVLIDRTELKQRESEDGSQGIIFMVAPYGIVG